MTNFTAEDVKLGGMDRLMTEFTASMPKLRMPWVVVIQHKNLLAKDYCDNFEKLGEVQLRSNCGSSTYAPNYADFCASFCVKDHESRSDQFMMPKAGEFTIEELQQQPYQKEH